MQPHAQYAMHPGAYTGPSPSHPDGMRNPSASFPAHPQRPHRNSIPSVLAAPVGGGSEGTNSSGPRDRLVLDEKVAGTAGYARWDEGSADRRLQQHRQTLPPVQADGRQVAQMARPLAADTAGVMEQHRGRASASPPHVPAASLAPPPPPPPPPVLSAAQQRHLRHLQQQQQQHDAGGDNVVGIPPCGGGGQQYMGRGLVLPSPSRHRIQHVEPKNSPRQQQQQQQGHWSNGQPNRPGVLPLPRYATAMPGGAPVCPSPVIKVPIYSTLSEAIEHQQKQQQQQQQQQQQMSRHAYPSVPLGGAPPPPPPPPPSTPVGGNAGHGFAAAMFKAPATPGRQSPSLTMVGGRDQRLAQQQQQQQQRWQQHPVLRRTHSIPAENERRGEVVAAAAAASTGGLDGNDRASPRGGVPPQSRSFGAPLAMPVPLQAPRAQGSMQAPPPNAPPAGLRLQMCGLTNTPMSAPVTPVMVYAPGHGYMMAYPPVNVPSVQTPRSTRSQASKAWDPYECVSPSGESTHAGFGRRGKETPDLSPEGSPVALSSAMSVSSRGSLSKQGGRGNDDASQGLRSRASSVTSDVIEGGGLNDDNRQNKANSQPSLAIPALLPLEGKADNEDGSYKTPSRVRLSCETSAGGTAADGEDKENSQVGAGLVGGGKKREGKAALEAKKQISGQKRAGGDIDIEKQKSFTGSYFQVSPSSFLQSSKRQRNFA